MKDPAAIEAELYQDAKSTVRRIEEKKFEIFVPTGVGEEFINLVGSGDYFVMLDSAANGTGKTTLGVNVLANIMWPGKNEWFRGRLFKEWPYQKRGRIISDPATIVNTIIPELKSWFPAGRYQTEKMGRPYEFRWTTDTGFSFDIMSNEQDEKEFESATLGWVWMDEPPPQPIYKATVARMRRGGIIFITATPLAGSAWMYDQIVTNVDHDAGQRTYVTADVESACIDHGVRGYLNHSDIQRMIAEYDPDDMQARVHGLFQHLIGLVFKTWERKIHIIKPFPIRPQEFSTMEMLDPHPRNPDAVLWVATDRYGQKFVVDELYMAVQGEEELAVRIKNKADNYRIVSRLCDPSAFIKDQHVDSSLSARLAKLGLTYVEATKDRRGADRRIQEALNYEKRGEELLRTPELYVFDHCVRTIFELEHYRWDEWRGKARNDKNPKEKPVDKDDHMIENLGRCLIQEPEFVPYDRLEAIRGRRVAVGEIRESSLDPYSSRRSEPTYAPGSGELDEGDFDPYGRH